MASPHGTDPRYQRAAIDCLQLIFAGACREDFAVRLWTGVTLPAAREAPFTLDISTPYALRAAFMPPLDLNPGRALVNGLLDISGDVEAAVEVMERALARLPARRVPSVICRLLRMPKPPPSDDCGNVRLRGRRHSRKRDRAAISFHYDQPVEFYASFLDRDLVYSCGYFEDVEMSLDDAQLAKIDYILRKLQLLPGDRLLDIGCGWGALVMRAAERFGAQAVGITLSRAQYEVAQRRIAERGLQERTSVSLRDYRDLQAELPYDKIVSVGMFEHVGRTNLTAYFDAAYAALRPGGLFLNHGIAEQSAGRRGGKSTGFIDRYVFPDSELVSISDGLRLAERVGFEVRDVENLREHYTRTLRAWVANLERNRELVVAATSLATYRAWRLYMAGSAQGFRSGRIGLFQSLLAKSQADGRVDLAPTRQMLYSAEAGGTADG
jgi:cyclopropane-fatty-acyl-phospholipid synthase